MIPGAVLALVEADERTPSHPPQPRSARITAWSAHNAQIRERTGNIVKVVSIEEESDRRLKIHLGLEGSK